MRLRALGVLLVLAGAVAACSGNIGGGASAVPGGQPGALGSGIPLPTGTPSSASGVVNVAPSAGPQTLPNVGGYTASVAFPQTSASPTTMNVVSSLVLPANIPAPFDLSTGGKRHGILGIGGKGKSEPPPYKALLYISLIPTKTLTFDHLPQFVFGVPETVIGSLGDKWDLGLGFFDPNDKSKKFKLAIADRIAVATAAPTPTVRTMTLRFADRRCRSTSNQSEKDRSIRRLLPGTAPTAGPRPPDVAAATDGPRARPA